MEENIKGCSYPLAFVYLSGSIKWQALLWESWHMLRNFSHSVSLCTLFDICNFLLFEILFLRPRPSSAWLTEVLLLSTFDFTPYYRSIRRQDTFVSKEENQSGSSSTRIAKAHEGFRLSLSALYTKASQDSFIYCVVKSAIRLFRIMFIHTDVYRIYYRIW